MSDLAVLLRTLEGEIDRLAEEDPPLGSRLDRRDLVEALDSVLLASVATGRVELGPLWDHLADRGVDERRRKDLLRALKATGDQHGLLVVLPSAAEVRTGLHEIRVEPKRATPTSQAPAPVLGLDPPVPRPPLEAPPSFEAPPTVSAPPSFEAPPTKAALEPDALEDTLRHVFARAPEMTAVVSVEETYRVLSTQRALADEDDPVDLTPLFVHLQAAGVPETPIHEALLALDARCRELGITTILPPATAAIAPEFRSQILEAFWAMPPTPPETQLAPPPARAPKGPAPAKEASPIFDVAPRRKSANADGATPPRRAASPILVGVAAALALVVAGGLFLFGGEEPPLPLGPEDLPCHHTRVRGQVILCVMDRPSFTQLASEDLDARTTRTNDKARARGFQGILLVDEEEQMLLAPAP